MTWVRGPTQVEREVGGGGGTGHTQCRMIEPKGVIHFGQ